MAKFTEILAATSVFEYNHNSPFRLFSSKATSKSISCSVASEFAMILLLPPRPFVVRRNRATHRIYQDRMLQLQTAMHEIQG